MPATRCRCRSSSPRTRAWPAGSGPPSGSTTTPTANWNRSSPAWSTGPTTTSARVCLEAFRKLLAGQVRDDTFGNGRFARNVLEAAVGKHAWRLRDATEPTLDQLRSLLPEDLTPDAAVDWPAPAAGGLEPPSDPAVQATT
ncbi:MAG: hypothetical protein QM711_01515 [Micropruina sp.]|uniref:hypothetical protein n=1 Tax=Micropruina sp. TaxID=2737536 RepID=UPI0039E3156A